MTNSNFHRLPQSKSIDSLRFLSPVSAFTRLIAVAASSPDSSTAALEIHSLTTANPDETLTLAPDLSLQSSLPCPSRIVALRSPRSVPPNSRLPLAFATFAGSVHFAFVDPLDGSLDPELFGPGPLHRGPVSGLDVAEGGGWECVSVGMDGRVNLMGVSEGGRAEWKQVADSKGLVGYSAVRYGSNVEFATGGMGFGLQWWDQRKPGGPVSQLKGNWVRGNMQGMVHSIDIHPSRKHICVVGGSSGTIFAWDLRWQQQPIMLSGTVSRGGMSQSPSESEVWEVQYDSHSLSSSISSAPSTKILPVMMCSEDGILAVLEQGEEPIELLGEPCAINDFDIDPQNPSDVICALEWESIGILMRPRTAMAAY